MSEIYIMALRVGPQNLNNVTMELPIQRVHVHAESCAFMY